MSAIAEIDDTRERRTDFFHSFSEICVTNIRAYLSKHLRGKVTKTG